MKKSKKSRSKLAVARDEWFASHEGQKCLDVTTIGSPCSETFLKNRLEYAFLAGAVAGHKRFRNTFL